VIEFGRSIGLVGGVKVCAATGGFTGGSMYFHTKGPSATDLPEEDFYGLKVCLLEYSKTDFTSTGNVVVGINEMQPDGTYGTTNQLFSRFFALNNYSGNGVTTTVNSFGNIYPVDSPMGGTSYLGQLVPSVCNVVFPPATRLQFIIQGSVAAVNYKLLWGQSDDPAELAAWLSASPWTPSAP
jgi:hypothetical protein